MFDAADTQDAERSQLETGPPDRLAPSSNSNPLFEDDEDLFRLDSSEFISGKQQQPSSNTNDGPQDQLEPVGGGGAANSNPTDTMDNQANEAKQIADEHNQQQHEAYLDWILDGGEDMTRLQAPSSDSLEFAPAISEPHGQQSERSSQQLQSVDRFGDKKIDDRLSPAHVDVSNSSDVVVHREGPPNRHRYHHGQWNNQRAEPSGQPPPSLANPFDHVQY